MTSSVAVNSVEGWQTVALASPVSVSSGQKVWLSFVFQNSVAVRYEAGTPGRAMSSQTWPAGMPDNFGTSGVSNYNFSVYCNYTPVEVNEKPLGNTVVYNTTSTAANRRAIPVTFNENGEINSISVYHNGGSGNMLLGVYTDVAGKPASRLGVTSLVAVNAAEGWQTVALANPVSVSSGQKVWLSFVFQNSVAVRYEAGTPGRAMSSQTWSAGIPDNFGTSGVSNYNFSVYCNYTPVEITEKPLGNTVVYSITSTAANRRAIPVTFNEDGTINSISVYHNGGSGNMLLGVYTDVAGKPASRLGVTSSVAVNAAEGWQTVALANPVSVSSGQKVWLSFVFQNSVAVRYEAGTPGRAMSSQTWSAGMPDNFGTSGVSNYNFSVYCSYTPVEISEKPLGNTVVYSTTSTAANRRAIPVTFNENGEINSISVYHNGGSGNMLLGVYTDVAGKPASRLGVTSSVAVNAAEGWQTVALANPVSVSSGQKVWLSFVFQNSVAVRYEAGTPGRAMSSQTWSAGMPDNFGTSGVSNYNFSVYCNYTPVEVNEKPWGILCLQHYFNRCEPTQFLLLLTKTVRLTAFRLSQRRFG
ncbi:MAG: hypothetical protein IPF54_16030 [Draconibacterium sp.]|nr:hypothetical protein [Draconibacterium sp.]